MCLLSIYSYCDFRVLDEDAIVCYLHHHHCGRIIALHSVSYSNHRSVILKVQICMHMCVHTVTVMAINYGPIIVYVLSVGNTNRCTILMYVRRQQYVFISFRDNTEQQQQHQQQQKQHGNKREEDECRRSTRAYSALLPYLRVPESLYLVLLCALQVYCLVVHPLVDRSGRFPFLPLLITSVSCALGVLWSWIVFYVKFLFGHPTTGKRSATEKAKKSQ